MAESIPAPLAAHPVIASGCCTRCGYDLAGLDPAAVCPECAYPVAGSLMPPNLLRTLDPKWLVSVVFGLRLLSLAGTLILVGGLCALVLMIGAIWFDQFTPRPITGPDWLWNSLIVSAGTALVVLHTAACLYLAAPGVPGLADPPRGRPLVRVAGAVFMPLSAWLFASQAVRTWPPWAVWVQAALFEAGLVVYLVGLVQLLCWLENRTPGWSALRAQRYRETMSNVRWFAALIVFFGWVVPWLAGLFSPTGEGAMVTGLIFLGIMRPLFARVYRLASEELAAAQARPALA